MGKLRRTKVDARVIRKLDLGGTAEYCSQDAVGLSYDGSMSGDEVTQVVCGDYNQMPFPNDCFDEAYGGCYLEGSDADGEWSCRCNYDELCRVLKPGAKVYLHGCAEYDFEGQETCNTIQSLFDLIVRTSIDATRAGFSSVVIKDGETYPLDGVLHIDTPEVHLVK